MTPGRRPLRYDSLDAITADVDRLLAGHTRVGRWSLAQICQHLATMTRLVVDAPPPTPDAPPPASNPDLKRQVFETGLLPEGIPLPPTLVLPPVREAREEAEGLRDALAHYAASPGPAIPHRVFGPLSREEWDRLVRIHCAHHLSFAIPDPS
ncbi:DUF1569 domain-containing protein [Tundrisphaera sp. TA3]|uniref:DUF1569 domain-containing protein n=1 Tax=Tundrisphaera sp. TA3 TaxID=3435775 RepID=UPI003EBCC45C